MNPSSKIITVILGGRRARTQTMITGKRVSQEKRKYIRSIGKIIPAIIATRGNWKNRITIAITIRKKILKNFRERAISLRRFIRKRLKKDDLENVAIKNYSIQKLF